VGLPYSFDPAAAVGARLRPQTGGRGLLGQDTDTGDGRGRGQGQTGAVEEDINGWDGSERYAETFA